MRSRESLEKRDDDDGEERTNERTNDELCNGGSCAVSLPLRFCLGDVGYYELVYYASKVFL